ncbi:hypothetical protein V8G54_001346 [Vigna mungo]|uniref:Uncharacterized protein n=1 Tax=Vigna mungo TaxID=3915 RepID=A0AAQ3S9V0_VIGMU
MNYYSAYDNCSLPYNAQPPTFDMFYEPFPEVFMQPTNLAFQQQPPPCFQPYCEQPPWLVQQELSHWDQYAEPEQENYQSLQPWQDQLCDKLQQGNSASELQGMTNQVAGLVSVVHKLTGRAAESTPATIEFQGFESQITSATASSTSQFYQDAYQPWQPQFGESEQQDTYSSDCMAHMWRVAAQLAKELNEAPLGTTSTIEFQADSNPGEEVDGPDQVYSELDIPIHVLEVQIDLNALDLLRVEPIKPAIDTVDLMPAHTHILDSVFHVEHIDIPDAVYDVCTELDHNFDDNFVQYAGSIDSVVVAEDILYESIQVYCNLETSTTSSEFTIPFDAIDCICIDPIEPVANSVELTDSMALKAAFEIEHIDVSIVVTELYTDFDTISIDGSCSECDIVATESSHTGEVVLEELVQVESDFNLAIGLSEMCPAINHLHALPDVHNFTIFVVHHIKTPTDGCSELKAVFSDDMINDLLSDDNIIAHAYIDTHANFELDVGAAEFSEKEAAGTEANLVEAGDGLNETQGPYSISSNCTRSLGCCRKESGKHIRSCQPLMES